MEPWINGIRYLENSEVQAMAYFDSPKNKAMWERELDELRKMRELRKNQPEAFSVEKSSENSKLHESSRVPMTLEDLMEEENLVTRKPSREVRLEPTMEKEKVMEKEKDMEKEKGMELTMEKDVFQ